MHETPLMKIQQLEISDWLDIVHLSSNIQVKNLKKKMLFYFFALKYTAMPVRNGTLTKNTIEMRPI